MGIVSDRLAFRLFLSSIRRARTFGDLVRPFVRLLRRVLTREPVAWWWIGERCQIVTLKPRFAEVLIAGAPIAKWQPVYLHANQLFPLPEK